LQQIILAGKAGQHKGAIFACDSTHSGQEEDGTRYRITGLIEDSPPEVNERRDRFACVAGVDITGGRVALQVCVAGVDITGGRVALVACVARLDITGGRVALVACVALPVRMAELDFRLGVAKSGGISGQSWVAELFPIVPRVAGHHAI
jgi:hypothetical protein